MRERKEIMKKVQEELSAYLAKEDSVTKAYKDKKKEHTIRIREIKKSRERMHEVEHELEAVKPQLIQLRKQSSFSRNKIAQAEATAKNMKEKHLGKIKEIDGLKRDFQELTAAKLELEARQQQAQVDDELVLKGSRLEEYHRIKEAVHLKTNILRTELDAILRHQTADQNKFETLSQEESENQKVIETLTEDLRAADDRIQKVTLDLLTLIDYYWLCMQYNLLRSVFDRCKMSLATQNALLLVLNMIWLMQKPT